MPRLPGTAIILRAFGVAWRQRKGKPRIRWIHDRHLACSENLPRLGNAFTVSAWVALEQLSVELGTGCRPERAPAGWIFLGIDAFGHVGFCAAVDGVWRQLTTETKLPLKKWVHVTGVFDGKSGLNILVDGKPAASLAAPGTFWQDVDATLVLGSVRSPRSRFRPGSAIRKTRSSIRWMGTWTKSSFRIGPFTRTGRGRLAGAFEAGGDVIPYAVLPSGPAGAGPFGAMYASLNYTTSWDRLRSIGSPTPMWLCASTSPRCGWSSGRGQTTFRPG